MVADTATVTRFDDRVTFPHPVADSRGFPYAEIRATPTLRKEKVSDEGLARPEGTLAFRVDQARTALFAIGQTLDSRRVWVPAYHCPALVEPLLAAGCQVAFYPLTPGLEPHPRFWEAAFQPGDAIVGVRYFGFDCGIQDLARHCREKQLVLIEDLAHAAYFDRLHGEFGCTSLVKFLPLDHGGELLVGRDHASLAALQDNYQRLETCRRVGTRTQWHRVLRKLRLKSPTGPSNYRYFDAGVACRGVSVADRGQIEGHDHAAVRSRRRANYRYLVDGLRNSHIGSPLMPELPEHVVPYVFPFVLHSAEHFAHLRKQSVQALRWEESAVASCPVSDGLRETLVQLPIHQDISHEQLETMIGLLTP